MDVQTLHFTDPGCEGSHGDTPDGKIPLHRKEQLTLGRRIVTGQTFQFLVKVLKA
jgi:hypothetical protein